MTVPSHLGLELVSPAVVGRFETFSLVRGRYLGAVDVRLSLRVGIAMVVGVLVAAGTPLLPTAVAAPGSLAGMVVFIDPGHNGANDASIGRQVPTGRGGTKDCQASGTTTNSGYPEHTFTWDTALRLRAALNALGVRTAMSRGNDNALGPCVDERALSLIHI